MTFMLFWLFDIWLLWERIWLQITKFVPIMHLGMLSDGIENGCHWPSRPFGYFDSEFQETISNVALVYRSKPVKGCYTSQTCSCFTFGAASNESYVKVTFVFQCVSASTDDKGKYLFVSLNTELFLHGNIMSSTRLPPYWSFVRGIYWSPGDFLEKAQSCGFVVCFFLCDVTSIFITMTS